MVPGVIESYYPFKRCVCTRDLLKRAVNVAYLLTNIPSFSKERCQAETGWCGSRAARIRLRVHGVELSGHMMRVGVGYSK